MPPVPLWKQLKRDIIGTLRLVDPDLPDVVIGTVLSTHLSGGALVWIYLQGASGSGKTEMLRMLGGVKVTQYTGFTANSLVSGWGGSTRNGRAVPAPSSMLEELNQKSLIIKDFSQIVTMPKDQLSKILGILRDAHDGDCIRQRFGGGTREVGFRTKFSVLAATTQQIEYAIEQADKAFGERFMTFSPHVRERTDHLRHAIAMSSSSATWREHLKGMVANFLDHSQPPAEMDLIRGTLEGVVEMADFTAAARSPVVRNKYRHDTVEAPPELEYGARVGKQLFTLGKMVQWLDGNPQRVMKRSAISSVPTVRRRILECIYRHSMRTVDQLATSVMVSNRVIQAEAENLGYLGILERCSVGNGNAGRPRTTFRCAPRWHESLEMMFGDQWMGLSSDEQAEVEELEARRHASRTRFDPNDYWPGEDD